MTIEKKEHVLFLYAKEVLDQPPSSVYFYDGYGKEGAAKIIYEHPKFQLRQWFAIGSVADINQIRDALLNQHMYQCQKPAIQFYIPTVSLIDRNSLNLVDKHQFVDDLPLPEANRQYFRYDDYPAFRANFLDSVKGDIVKNLAVEGNQMDLAKDIFPYGFISLSELGNYLQENIAVVDESIIITFDFHGERTEGRLKVKSPRNFVGVVCYSSIQIENLGVIISSEKLDTNLLLQGDINSINAKNGLVEIRLKEPLSKGYIYFVNKASGECLAASHFVLISNINVNVGVVAATMIDVFGETVSVIGEKGKIEAKPIQREYSFFREAFPAYDEQGYLRLLADQIKEVLLSLGPNPLFMDPYLMGKLSLQDDKIVTTNDNAIFINALLLVLARYDLQSISFLCRRRMTDIAESESVPKHYVSLVQDLRRLNDKFKIIIRFANEAFHDRYWLDQSTQSTILLVSTSISGLAANRELRIQPIAGPAEVLKTKDRIFRIWSEAAQSEIII